MVKMFTVAALALLLVACEIQTTVYQPAPQPAATYPVGYPPPQASAVPYYYPPGCVSVECTEPVYYADSGYWLTSGGFRLAASDAILYWALTTPHPNRWVEYHRRWDYWYWNTYRRPYNWNNRHWGHYYRQYNWNQRPPWQRPHRRKW